MTDVFDRVRAANPVPDPDRYYESVTGNGRQLLGSIRDRRDHMTVEEITRLETPPAPQSPSGLRSWRVAVVAAAAVVALVVGVVALGGGGDDVAGPTDLEIAERFVALLESGDVAGYEALVDSEAVAGGGPFFGPPSTTWAYVSGFQAATHGTYTAECGETPTSPTVDVVCKTAESNIFREVSGINPNRYDWSFAVEDGTITLLNFGGDAITPIVEEIMEYGGWLQANYPDEYGELMAVPVEVFEFVGQAESTLSMPVVDSAAQRARHAELTTEWAASRP